MAYGLNLSGLANQVRVGTILEIDSEECTAVVSVPEITLTLLTASNGGDSSSYYSGTDISARVTSSMVRRTVRVLTRGSKTIKDYFNYEVGEPVICIFPVSTNAVEVLNSSVGYIVGTFFDFWSEDRRPPAYYEKVRLIDFGDGTYIEYNTEDKNLIIECKGDVEINGKNIYLNG